MLKGPVGVSFYKIGDKNLKTLFLSINIKKIEKIPPILHRDFRNHKERLDPREGKDLMDADLYW